MWVLSMSMIVTICVDLLMLREMKRIFIFSLQLRACVSFSVFRNSSGSPGICCSHVNDSGFPKTGNRNNIRSAEARPAVHSEEARDVVQGSEGEEEAGVGRGPEW